MDSRFNMWTKLVVLICTLYLVGAPRPFVEDPTCPRKPDLVSQRKCLKKCRNDLDCKGHSRSCLCDDVCGKSCVRRTQRCETLKPILNGKFDINSFNTFAAKVRYMCNEGYILSGNPERVCQGDGYWSGAPPTCETEGKCRDPPEVMHAYHDGPKGQLIFPLGTQLTYSCQTGYNIDGFFRAMCVGEGRWVGPRMTCAARRCDPPGDIPNGYRKGNVFVFPNRVEYVCMDGYEMVGRPFRVCEANGRWSDSVPMCRPVKCNRLSPPSNGQMVGTDFTFGAVVRFSCTRGFSLSGAAARRCEKDGRWTGKEAQCSPTDCGVPGPFYYGYLDGNSTLYGAVLNFTCYSRTKFEGPSVTTVCQDNGKWSHPVPNCWKHCRLPDIANATIIKTGDDDIVDHGTRLEARCAVGHVLSDLTKGVCHNGTWSTLPKCVPASCHNRPQDIREGYVRFYGMKHGDRAKYKCNTGYALRGDQYATCHYGTWQGKVPICDPVYCDYPGTIENGQILLVGVIGKYEYRRYVQRKGHNEQIEFQCDKAYKRVGPAAATCVGNEWSPKEKPVCVPKQHPKLLYIFRGKRSLGMPDQPGDARAATPREQGYCAVPHVIHGRVTSHPQGHFVPSGDILKVVCKGRKYVLGIEPRERPDGDSMDDADSTAVVCQDGLWSAKVTCTKRGATADDEDRSDAGPGGSRPRGAVSMDYDKGFCDVPVVANGNVTNYPEGDYVPHGSVLSVQCHGDDYVLTWRPSDVDDDVSTLDALTEEELEGQCVDGQWSSLPLCSPVYCSHPGIINNAKVFIQGILGLYEYRKYMKIVEDGAQIKYACVDDGIRHFRRTGPERRTCHNGKWQPDDTVRCLPENDTRLLAPSTDRRKRSIDAMIKELDQDSGELLGKNYDKLSEENNIIEDENRFSDFPEDHIGIIGTNEEQESVDLEKEQELADTEEEQELADTEEEQELADTEEEQELADTEEEQELADTEEEQMLADTEEEQELADTEEEQELADTEEEQEVADTEEEQDPGDFDEEQELSNLAKEKQLENLDWRKFQNQQADIYHIDYDKGFCVVPNITNGVILNFPEGFFVPHGSVLSVRCVPGFLLDLTPDPEGLPGHQEHPALTVKVLDEIRCNDGMWTGKATCTNERLR